MSKPLRLRLLALAALVLPAFAQPPDPIAETLSGFEESIRLRGQLSEERHRHERQMRVLEAEVRLLESALEETSRQISAIRSERSETRIRREDLLERKASEAEKLAALESLSEDLAPRLGQLEKVLPPWITPAAQSQADSPGAVFRRMHRLLLDERSIAAVRTEIPEPVTGEKILVDVLGFGYGIGFFASPDGSFGGRFVFDGREWSAEPINELAPRIREAVQQERGLGEPRLLSLPVAIGGSP